MTHPSGMNLGLKELDAFDRTMLRRTTAVLQPVGPWLSQQRLCCQEKYRNPSRAAPTIPT
jgi:hypothetical protein